jgi:arginine deiminase
MNELAPERLAEVLIGGVALDELPFAPAGLAAAVDGLALVLPPLPNHLFTRDTSCWVYGGVSVNHMAYPARRREALHVSAIYRRHPLFAGPRKEVWSDGMNGAARLEGGDVLVLGRGALLVGMGERTRPGAVEALAQRLFDAHAAREVLAVDLPKQRSCMHLDTVLTMLDADACTIYPEIVAAPAYRLTPGRGGVAAERVPALLDAIATALGVERLRIIETGGDRYEVQREQWDDGNNVLAIAPGVVVAYERNVDTNARLREAGIEVITIAGAELERAGVGARAIAVPDASPGRVLHLAAEREHADLIVVGSAHRGPIGRVLAGDVTAGTLHSSPCPVVVAPAGYAQQGGRLETIGVGYDGSPESRAALDLARDLAETADARLRIIDVVVAPGADALVDGYRPDWTEEARIRREEAEARVQRVVADLGPIATGEIAFGEAADALAFAGNSLDLLVTGSRNYGPIRRLMLGSTSSKLVHRAPCPVLVTTRSVEDAPAGAATASTGAQAS